MLSCRIIPRLRYTHLLSIAGVIVFYAVTFGLLLPVILQDWPYSPYYNHSLDNLDVIRKVVWVCFLLLICGIFVSDVFV